MNADALESGTTAAETRESGKGKAAPVRYRVAAFSLSYYWSLEPEA
jgi:hypothetical protein